MPTTIRENRVLLGNPGTGKSTLINCLAGRTVFQSGISWGAGLTQEYQRYIVGDVAYMDTPGLADLSIIDKAARAINTALSQSGTYKLFFMVRLQSGRVVSDDLTTVERVLDAINIPNVPFSILINNLAKRQYETMTKFGVEFDKVSALINKGKYSTPFIFFIPKFEQLDEEDNAVIQLPNQVLQFLEQRAPAVYIPAAAVGQINVKGFHEAAKELKDELERLRENHAELARLIQRQKTRFGEELKREQRYRQSNADYYRYYRGTPQKHKHVRPVKKKRSDCVVM